MEGSENKKLTSEQQETMKRALEQAKRAKDRSLIGWGIKPGETREQMQQRDEVENPSIK